MSVYWVYIITLIHQFVAFLFQSFPTIYIICVLQLPLLLSKLPQL